MSDDLTIIPSGEESNPTAATELHELEATLRELKAGGTDDLSKQAIASTEERIAEIKQANPGIH